MYSGHPSIPTHKGCWEQRWRSIGLPIGCRKLPEIFRHSATCLGAADFSRVVRLPCPVAPKSCRL